MQKSGRKKRRTKIDFVRRNRANPGRRSCGKDGENETLGDAEETLGGETRKGKGEKSRGGEEEEEEEEGEIRIENRENRME